MNGIRIEKTTVLYKGRKYELVEIGPTKYGIRAKLRFLNGTKEFLVREDAITIVKVESKLITDDDFLRMIDEL